MTETETKAAWLVRYFGPTEVAAEVFIGTREGAGAYADDKGGQHGYSLTPAPLASPPPSHRYFTLAQGEYSEYHLNGVYRLPEGVYEPYRDEWVRLGAEEVRICRKFAGVGHWRERSNAVRPIKDAQKALWSKIKAEAEPVDSFEFWVNDPNEEN